MATITARPTHAQLHTRVQHPLERLRGSIRTYVGLEGAAILVLYLAAWFWIGLALDYGFFKLFTVDWVQELPWGLRAATLAILIAGLLAVVAVKVILRLTREFSEPALALVLERRFPKELGDRLITAVELADVQKAARYGYSGPMIEQTIQDAADRVEKLPVGQVFDWKRLQRLWQIAGVATFGIYVFAGLVFYLVSQISGAGYGLRTYAGGFNDVASIWFERNILLQNTIWPRKAHLELVGFPESGELRIGRDAPPTTVRVRALRWVIADKKAPEGWRALAWNDLNADLLGSGVELTPAP